jgi:hypothetical protein
LDCEKRGTIKPLLFEALLRISDACGLHPTCFPLSGLQTIGNPIAAGGFGDIWKGLVRGQTVAVKIMRVFWDQDIPISLKVRFPSHLTAVDAHICRNLAEKLLSGASFATRTYSPSLVYIISINDSASYRRGWNGEMSCSSCVASHPILIASHS